MHLAALNREMMSNENDGFNDCHSNTDQSAGCIFCNIVNGTTPSHKVWESSSHLAFLSIFPNTPGVTVVIPKRHFKSYAFELPEDELVALMLASKTVALLLDIKLKTNRTAMVFEGYGVDHVHAKLYPMHCAPASDAWTAVESPEEKKSEFHHFYPGYITSHDGDRASDNDLSAIALKILS